MAQGSFSATATSSVIVAADEYRKYVLIQLVSGNAVAIGIGATAVYGKGPHMINAGDPVKITGYQATLAINGICDTGNTANVAYQTG